MLKNTNYQVGVLKALKTRQILEIGCDFIKMERKTHHPKGSGI